MEGEGLCSTAKTSVWWDVVRCGVPKDCDPHLIAGNIISALAQMGYMGDVTIYAFVDAREIPKSVEQALISTGIKLQHVPAGKTADDAKLRKSTVYGDMMIWKIHNGPPANFLVISDDYDYYSVPFIWLRDWGYNVVLELPPDGPPAEGESLLRGILGGGLPSSILSKLGYQKKALRGEQGQPSSSISSSDLPLGLPFCPGLRRWRPPPS